VYLLCSTLSTHYSTDVAPVGQGDRKARLIRPLHEDRDEHVDVAFYYFASATGKGCVIDQDNSIAGFVLL
jgi:hypothetical protein